MNDLELFVECVRQNSDLPESVRKRAADVAALRTQLFDDALLSLMDSQIQLSTRGPEWTERLLRQREALLPYRNKRLLKGRIQLHLDAYWIYVNPENHSIVYWECYQNWAEQL
jgi:hypothetical protein